MKGTICASVFFSMAAMSVSLAEEVNIPNQFQAGTPAVAAEVNENFAAIEVAVDDNAADIDELRVSVAAAIANLQASLSGSVAVNVDGEKVGSLMGNKMPPVFLSIEGTDHASEDLFTTGGVVVMSPNGYLFKLSMRDASNTGGPSEGQLLTYQIVYDQIDCQGNRWAPVNGETGFYSNLSTTSMSVPVARQGIVFSSGGVLNSAQAYFAPRNSTIEMVTVLSGVTPVDPATGAPGCINLEDIAVVYGYPPGTPPQAAPEFYLHPVVPVIDNIAPETGVSGVLGGEISFGSTDP